MRILVILRRVLDPAGIVAHRRLRQLFINREVYIIQPGDHAALEAGLRIKESAAAEVIVVSGQPEPDDDTVRRGLAMGADRGIYLTGGDFTEADEVVMTRLLEAVIGRLGGVDLVLVGLTTLDTAQGQLGPRLAEALGWPQIVGAWSVDAVDGRLKAVLRDGEEYLRVETDAPAVVTVPDRAFQPRYPDGARLINVFRGEAGMEEAVEEWDVTGLVDPGVLVPVLESRGRDFPSERERGVRVEGTPEEAGQTVAEALRSRLGM